MQQPGLEAEALFINEQLMIYKDTPGNDESHQYADYILRMLSDLKASPFYLHLKSKGMGEDKIKWIEHCFELDSKENLRKAGPYNWVIATFKMIKGLEVEPYYYFKESDISITSLSHFKSIPPTEIKSELEDGYLREWLTVFFQEDPNKNLSARLSYEKETLKYIEFIEKLDSEDTDVSNFRIGTNFLNTNFRKVRRRCRTLMAMRILLGVFCFIPLLGCVVALAVYGLPFTENPLPVFSAEAIAVMGVVFALLIYVMSDYSSIIGNIIAGFIVGAAVYYAVYAILDQFMPQASYALAGLLLLLIYFLMRGCYTILPVARKAHIHLLKPTFEARVLAPLRFAFKADAGARFNPPIAKEIVEYDDYLKDCIRKLSYHGVLSLLIVGWLAFMLMHYSPSLRLDVSCLLPGDSKIKELVGTWEGTFGGRNATLNITEAGAQVLKATIHVQYSSLTDEELVGSVNTAANTIHFDDVHKNGTLDGKYDGTFVGDGMETFEGTYENYTTGKQAKFSFSRAKVHAEN